MFIYFQVNTFQCVMSTDGLNSFLIFLYADNQIQWTTGAASGGRRGLGGTPAVAGFSAGDGVRFEQILGSLTPEIIDIESTSNIGRRGVWVYRVNEELPAGKGDRSGVWVFRVNGAGEVL